jgi:hypothetical protein
MTVLFIKNNRLGSKYWINSAEKSFSTLVAESKMLPEFSNSSLLKNMGYRDKVLVPVNPYVEYFYPKPELIKTNTEIILRQKTHAEIWVEYKKDYLYMLDKCWQRQFYPSKNICDSLNNNPVYRFYVPWTIEFEDSFLIESTSPVFDIYTKSITFSKRDFDNNFIDTPFVDFTIKKHGPHMKTDDYGIVNVGTPIYDIIIKNSDISERIIKEYESNI